MANRTVAVALRAEISQYVAGMSQASAATMRVGESARASQETASKHFDLAGKAGIIAGGAIVAGLGMAINASMQFEQSMSAVQAATHATAGTMSDLRAAAIKAGADTAYSATEAADAITEMSKAGVSAKDIMGGGLKGALSLAAAGQLDVADAAGIAATAMQQFHLAGSDLPHVADLLAAGAGKAMGSVQDLSVALKYVGPVAAGMGVSIEETTGTLALFASQGILSDQAGTSLRGMLTALTSPSKLAAAEMSDLGINVFNAQGNFVGLDGVAGQLHDSLSGLSEAQRSQALGMIFGNEQITAARVLYQGGSQAVEDWTSKVNDSGYAAETAAAMQDNLRGDIEKLGGSFQTLLINIGSGAQGPLRDITQMFTGLLNATSGLVDVFASIPGPAIAMAGALGGIALLNGPLSGVLGTLREFGGNMLTGPAGTVGAFSEALGYARANGDGLGTVLRSVGGYAGGEMKSAFGGLAALFGGPWGLAIAGIVGSFELLSSVTDDNRKVTSYAADAQVGLADALKQSKGALDENVRSAAAKSLQDAHLLDIGNQAGISLSSMTDAILGNKEAYDQVSGALKNYATGRLIASGYEDDGSHKLHDQSDAAGQAVKDFATLSGVLGQTAAEQQQLTEATGAAGDAVAASAQQSDEAVKAYQKWIDQLQGLGAAFADPLAVYKGLLSDKQQAEQEAAQATADATADSKDSWHDYVGDVSVSLDELATKFEEQLTAQANWRTNIGQIAQWAGADVANYLAAMGQDGVQLVGQMADGTTAEAQRMANDIRTDIQSGSEGWAVDMDQGTKVMAQIGKDGAAATAAGVANELGIGADVVATIAQQYGLNLASGLNPLLMAVGKPQVSFIGLQSNYSTPSMRGGTGYASGGYTGDGGKYTPAGIVHKGEFVMPQEAVGRIGVSTLGAMAGLPGYANGGFVTAADVPKPSSTSPFGPPISTAADGTMQTGYDAATAWLNANAPSMFTGMAGGGVQQWLPVVLQALGMVGQPASLAQTVLRRMNQESGGNPAAINNWDVNAKNGTPSKGLMQVIDPTFRANAYPGYSSNIYDPLSNILASMEYAIRHYGSLSAAYNKAGGYANGGTTPTGSPFWVGEQGPELMWSSREHYVSTAAQSREFSGASGGGTGSNSTSALSGPVQVSLQLDGPSVTSLLRGEAVSVIGGISRGLNAQGVRP